MTFLIVLKLCINALIYKESLSIMKLVTKSNVFDFPHGYQPRNKTPIFKYNSKHNLLRASPIAS